MFPRRRPAGDPTRAAPVRAAWRPRRGVSGRAKHARQLADPLALRRALGRQLGVVRSRPSLPVPRIQEQGLGRRTPRPAWRWHSPARPLGRPPRGSSRGTARSARPMRTASSAPDPTTADHQLEGARVAHGLDQRQGPPEVRDQPEARLLHRELHVVGHDHHVAGQRQLEAGADRMALHGGDRRPLGCVATRRRPAGRWRSARRGRQAACAPNCSSDPSPGMPSGVSIRRSSPAENGRPVARRARPRGRAGRGSAPIDASSRQRPGSWALRVSGRVRRTVSISVGQVLC